MGVALTAEPMQAWQGVLIKVNVIVNNASLETRYMGYTLVRINSDLSQTLLSSEQAYVPPLGAMQVEVNVSMPLGDLNLQVRSYFWGLDDWVPDGNTELTVAYIAPIAAQFQTLEAQFLKV